MEKGVECMPSIIDNRTILLKDDLKNTLKEDSKINIAASCFSIYAFKELKKQLEEIDSLRFLFTSPTFIKDKPQKESREFYIPRVSRESSLSGSPFEIRLRNELTQKAISKECANWIKQKVTFKSNTTSDSMSGFMTVSNKSSEPIVYTPMTGFTTIELGCERGNAMYSMINKLEAPYSKQYLELFDSVWNDTKRMENVTETVLESISEVYTENAPDFLYYVALYNIFHEFLQDVSEDVIANDGGIQLEDKHHQESGERLQEHEELHEHDLLRLWRIVSPPAANHVELPTTNSERPNLWKEVRLRGSKNSMG
jgi:hypothetical protein